MRAILLVLLLAGCTSPAERWMENYCGLDCRSERLKQSHPDIWADWGPNGVEDGKVFVGMPKEAVRASWGDPSRVTRRSYAGDIWFYHNSWTSSTRTVWFDGDIVEDWQVN